MPRHELSAFEKHIRRIIAQNLKSASWGMTQAELGAKSGIPTSTISGYFAQRSTPSPGNVQRLADALSMPKSAIDPRFDDHLFEKQPGIEDLYNQLSPNRQQIVLHVAQEQLTEQRRQS